MVSNFWADPSVDGVGRVDAVHLGRLEDDVRLDLQGAEGGRRVRREIGAADAGGEDDDASLLEVADDPAADERLGHGLDLDGGYVPGDDALLLEGVLEGDAVDHGRQEPHLVGRSPVHAGLGPAVAAEDVAAADHDGELDAEVPDLLELSGDGGDPLEIDALAPGPEKGLAGQLQEDPLISGFRLRHGAPPSRQDHLPISYRVKRPTLMFSPILATADWMSWRMVTLSSLMKIWSRRQTSS